MTIFEKIKGISLPNIEGILEVAAVEMSILSHTGLVSSTCPDIVNIEDFVALESFVCCFDFDVVDILYLLLLELLMSCPSLNARVFFVKTWLQVLFLALDVLSKNFKSLIVVVPVVSLS